MSSHSSVSLWHQRPCVIATMHKKEGVIAPVVQSALGVEIVVPTDFDTDQFGTFTRDIQRTGSQREAAQKKAVTALEHTSHTLAIASEGSFGAHPTIPFIQSNLELVLLVDQENQLEIAGHYHSTVPLTKHHTARTPEEVMATAKSWGFPKQGVILRSHAREYKHIYKDLLTFDDLYTASHAILKKWFVHSIFMETDLRAHRCPSRQDAIRQAVLDLVTNCQSNCPICHIPGFTIRDRQSGLPCAICGLPTSEIKSATWSCQKCHYEETEPVTNKQVADPGLCQWCNP